MQNQSFNYCQTDACRIGGINELIAVYLMAAKFNGNLFVNLTGYKPQFHMEHENKPEPEKLATFWRAFQHDFPIRNHVLVATSLLKLPNTTIAPSHSGRTSGFSARVSPCGRSGNVRTGATSFFLRLHCRIWITWKQVKPPLTCGTLSITWENSFATIGHEAPLHEFTFFTEWQNTQITCTSIWSFPL